ncbi:MAG: sigma-54-dependent Fis family transcriptional regulator [Candidatus Auribacter fodinae]|jgi:Nif-specific regulatory protein|uniref:Sigma-54-dependent Fis family transcriptional regulator n=1 Tax=Candidatus Auribacter fodinae TaxID=2093366 RepID=A0A3A4QXZ5_9BACT|nr:MAG: sigma-54-dependent Fis family transcriptional regulator [Candidatus Auribacter fodinae]
MNNVDYKKYFELLLSASKLINASFSLNQALEDIIKAATLSLSAEAASLLFVNQRTQTLFFKAASGNVADALKDQSINLGEGIVGWVAKERKSLIVHDAKSDPRHKSDIDKDTGFSTRSIIASPVEYQGEVLGTLEVLNPIDKPYFDENDLILLEALASQVAIVIRHCTSYAKLNQQNIELKKVINLEHKIIGNSTVIQNVLQRIAKIAPFDVTVLINGESGTGKELVARALHDNSPRSKKPFIAINCTALPENLIESELFGHEKGAFTGAIASRKGKFETASGGTLFLDEIGDMGMSMQAKILRVLETNIYERVGSDQPMQANVRIIAATNKNLKQLVDEQKFREDLYYRLNEMQIELPPLKERKSDIMLLVNHFLNIFSASFHKEVTGISKEVKDILMNYDWPGNIRELKNVIKAAVVLCDTDTLEECDLPEEIRTVNVEVFSLTGETGSLDLLEKKYIAKILKENNWKKSKTAKILNISRPTLDAKIKQYGILIQK